jgi:hypothetical protein
MTARLPDPVDSFMDHARLVAAHAAGRNPVQVYEHLKRQYQARFPGHDNREYEHYMLELERIAGI